LGVGSASITGIQMEMADVVIQFIMLSAAVLMLLFVTAFGQEKVLTTSVLSSLSRPSSSQGWCVIACFVVVAWCD
jgi:hypothetical protein